MKNEFTKEEKEILFKVKFRYDMVGTISGVAKILGMQPWRVRKYLHKGHRYGLFVVDKFNKRREARQDRQLFNANPMKIIKYQGNRYTLGELLGLWKERGSLIKVSESTRIPYHKLYRIFRKHFGKKIFKIKKQVGFIKGKDHGYTYNHSCPNYD